MNAGNEPSDPRLDFADAAETLAALQDQLREFQDLTDALDGVVDRGGELAAASLDLAEAQRVVAEAQRNADPVSASVSQSVASLHETVRSLKADVQDVADRLDGAAPGRGPRRPPSSPWNAATASIIGLLTLVLVLLGIQWYTAGGEGAAPATPTSSSSDAAATVQQTLYPHHDDVESIREARVQVLNGVGAPGLASRFQAAIEDTGASVPSIGNLPIGTASTSRIYLHRNAFAIAQQLADRLGLNHRQIVPGPPATDAAVDMTLVVGADYETLAPYQ